MKWTTTVAFGAAVAVLSVAGCENSNSIYRETQLDSGTTLITDAKQRAVINTRDYRASRQGSNHRIICAEPSPDVAQAMSVALQAGVSVTNGNTKVDANLALAIASQVAQLGERLAAIQLLRDKMYRACEAYANGATSQGGYISVLARVDKTMATMLAMEMAAGAFGRNLASAGSSASTSPGADPAKVKAAADQVKSDAKAFEDAQAALAANTDDNKKADLQNALLKAGAKVKQSATDLVQLELSQAGVSASGIASSNPIGAISGTRVGDPFAVASIHKTFFDDDGVEGLIDACVTELSSSRYTYDDFLSEAKRNGRYPTIEQRAAAGVDKPGQPRPIAISDADYLRHYANFIEYRIKFANYCLNSVFGDNSHKTWRSFIAQRIASKEKLRAMAEKTALVQQCAPVLLKTTKLTDGESVLLNYCKAAMKGV